MTTVSVLQGYHDKLFFRVRVRIKFRDRVLAGIPKNESVLDWFMNQRHMSDEEKQDFINRVKTGVLTDEEKSEIKETSWCQFEKDSEGNLCMWHGNMKAMLREIFTTLGLTQKRPKTAAPKKDKKVASNDTEARDEDIAASTPVSVPVVEDKTGLSGQSAGGRQTLQHAVHIDGNDSTRGRVRFEVNNAFIKEPTGSFDMVKHVKDAAGIRSCLGRHDYIENAEMEFTLKWPNKGVFNEEEMKISLAAAQEDGLGACRSMGRGKFDVIKFEVLK